MEHSIWLWVGFNLFVLALLAFDLGVLHRRRREIRVAEALWLSLFYFALAMAFAAGVFHFLGARSGWEFVTGYLIEKSLSLDNIFVFVLIFTHFAVPAQHQHRVLVWGILGALVMRGLLIAAGTALIAAFHWVVFVFGAFLLATGVRMLWAVDAEPDIDGNFLVRFVRRRFRMTEDFAGDRFFLRRDGALWATPLFLVLVVVEASDVVFALDSIPAIFAVTDDAFIVYTANVFAILGLRALYFALADVVHRFYYLRYALSLVLVLIGAKMIVNGFFEEKVIPVEAALVATAVLVLGSIALSLLRGRAVPGRVRGWVPWSSRVRRRDRAGEGER